MANVAPDINESSVASVAPTFAWPSRSTKLPSRTPSPPIETGAAASRRTTGSVTARTENGV